MDIFHKYNTIDIEVLNMSPSDIIDEIVASLDPEHIPMEYIVMGRITLFNGSEKIIKGNELEMVLKHPERYNIAEARVVLDVKKIRKVIVDEINDIYDQVNNNISNHYTGVVSLKQD